MAAPVDLLMHQNLLQQHAKQILDDIQLLSSLSTLGKPQVIGSAALGLMIWRDVDIEIIVHQFEKKKIAELMQNLMQYEQRRIDFSFVDNHDREDQRLPTGMYLGMKYYGLDVAPVERYRTNEKVWKIDMWFVLAQHARGTQKTQEIEKQLDDEKRSIILDIKHTFVAHPKYHKGIYSTDIYDAVLQHNVKNAEQFLAYMQRIGKTI